MQFFKRNMLYMLRFLVVFSALVILVSKFELASKFEAYASDNLKNAADSDDLWSYFMFLFMD